MEASKRFFSTLYPSIVALGFHTSPGLHAMEIIWQKAQRLGLQFIAFIQSRQGVVWTNVMRLYPKVAFLVMCGYTEASQLSVFNPEIKLLLFPGEDPLGSEEIGDYFVIAHDPAKRSPHPLRNDIVHAAVYNLNLTADVLQKHDDGNSFPVTGGDTLLLLRGEPAKITTGLASIGLRVLHLFRHQPPHQGEEELGKLQLLEVCEASNYPWPSIQIEGP